MGASADRTGDTHADLVRHFVVSKHVGIRRGLAYEARDERAQRRSHQEHDGLPEGGLTLCVLGNGFLQAFCKSRLQCL